MRTFLLGLPLGCLVASVLFAASQPANPRETIWLGVDLTLGMSEEAVVKKIAESGSGLRKVEPPEKLRAKGITSLWIVEEKGEGNKNIPIGSITFATGKLQSVAKDLLPDDADEVEFGRQLYFAMRDLEEEGDSRCTIDTENAEVPDFSERTAKLHCGRKTIVVELQRFLKHPESVQLNEVLDAR